MKDVSDTISGRLKPTNLLDMSLFFIIKVCIMSIIISVILSSMGILL